MGSLAVPVESNFQSAGFQVGHSVTFVALKQKSGQRRRRKAGIAGRNAKKEHFLSAWKNARAEDIWKNFAQPRAAGKNELPRRNVLAMIRCDVLHAAQSRWPAHLCGPIFHAMLNRILYNGRDRAPRHQRAALCFEKPGRNASKTNLGKLLFKRPNIHLFERHTASRECRGRLPEARIVAAREPQNTGLMKKALLLPCGK